MKVLISDKADKKCAAIFRAAGIEVDEKTGLKPEELKAIIGEYDGLVIRSATTVTADLLSAASKLKVVGRAGTGVDNVDVPAATAKKVIVMNTPGQNSNAVAELVLGMMFGLARHIPRGCAGIKACKWEKKALEGREVIGKTLGIVGFGAIGRLVADLGKGIKMDVIAYDPFLTPEQIKEKGGTPVTLDELYAQADYITLHVPKTKDTSNMINATSIAKMKDGAYVINCARGGVVDEEALYEALKSGKLAGAALDVFAVEPPGESKLITLDNFIATPHIGASTVEAQINVAVAVAEQMVKYLKEGVILNAVNA